MLSFILFKRINIIILNKYSKAKQIQNDIIILVILYDFFIDYIYNVNILFHYIILRNDHLHFITYKEANNI
jgi:hypothetical protein